MIFALAFSNFLNGRAEDWAAHVLCTHETAQHGVVWTVVAASRPGRRQTSVRVAVDERANGCCCGVAGFCRRGNERLYPCGRAALPFTFVFVCTHNKYLRVLIHVYGTAWVQRGCVYRVVLKSCRPNFNVLVFTQRLSRRELMRTFSYASNRFFFS